MKVICVKRFRKQKPLSGTELEVDRIANHPTVE